ncbi:molybdenum cofactor guanylyltransferase [Natrinema halophilum]|uniref:Probable molybdenum cofactor guanylyltransferase n=1 Tax=Natrinema halophilum TaxID=1699371 RepID=A0A7D5GQG0_9EURY|nr:molybdenum cofactor guanylyltransferase [Natrinema halophilum]QLG47446.1 molybdenum cofactor guanylyltransferase [Natrinema halophilum]
MASETGRDDRTGLILAGGHSTRFGDEDKALADLAGTPMIRRVFRRLEPVVDDIVVNCRMEQVPAIRTALADGPNASFAVDPIPDRGPVAGILTGLREATTAYAAVVGCDMPFIDTALVDHLFERASGHDAAVPRLDDRWFQTTQAVYQAKPMAEACERALERDERRIVEPLFELDYVVVDENEVRSHASLETFENVNTREELEAAATRLEAE